MKHLFLCSCILYWMSGLNAQTVTGSWKTIDDDTGQPKSHLQLYEENGVMYGKVIKILTANPDRLCDKCPGERKNKPVLNMIVVVDMKQKEGYYQSGEILDPENGKWYRCKMWLKEGDSNTLVVRGYIGPFYRTQYWHRL